MDELCNKSCKMLLMDRTKINWSVLDKILSQGKQMGLLIFWKLVAVAYMLFMGPFKLELSQLNGFLHAIWKLFKDSSS